MGKILGTEYVKSTLGYSTGPSRLIQRDHQEWALRGDDVLGARMRVKKVEFVKPAAPRVRRIVMRRVSETQATLIFRLLDRAYWPQY